MTGISERERMMDDDRVDQTPAGNGRRGPGNALLGVIVLVLVLVVAWLIVEQNKDRGPSIDVDVTVPSDVGGGGQ